MEDNLLSRSRTVTDPKAAAALANPMLRRIVLRFAGAERSIGEVAAQSGADLKRLHHNVKRLQKLGLLEVASVRPRAGRPVKLYRAVAPSFFVPMEVVPEVFSEGLARELRSSIRGHLTRSGHGILLSLDEDGAPQMRMIGDTSPGSPAEFWLVLRLSSSEAEALRQDMQDLLKRHAAQSRGAGKQFLVHAALAPRPSDSVSVDNAPRRMR